MAELEIEGSFAEEWGIVKSAIKQHHSTLYGNGQPGILEFVQGTKAQFRLLIALVSVVGVIVAILTFLEANRQVHSGELKLPRFGYSTIDSVYAKNKNITTDTAPAVDRQTIGKEYTWQTNLMNSK